MGNANELGMQASQAGSEHSMRTLGELRPADEGVEAGGEDPSAQPRVLPQQHRLNREASVLQCSTSTACIRMP